MKTSPAWAWGAAGKHPVVKDYISLGEDTQVMRAFSRWVEEGWSRIGETSSLRSWRIFTRGLKPDELACGLVKSSHDRAGRPFPLIVMGHGRMDGWERQWELLPAVFDPVWERMEFISVKRVFDLDELKGDISRLPVPGLEGFVMDGPVTADKSLGTALSRGGRDTATVPLNGAGDHRDEAIRLLKGMKDQNLPAPAAAFIGGPLDKAMLAVFMRSLSTADFEGLWTAG